MHEVIDTERRRFLEAAALAMGAAPFAAAGAGFAQSTDAKAQTSATTTGTDTRTATGASTGSGATTSAVPAFGALKQIEAGGLSIGYADVGRSGAAVVMLLHGWPYDIHTYADVAPMLASAGYRVIVPYLRGYGTTRFLSADTPRNGQQSVLAADIIALMDALAIDKAIVAGCDWGARTANIIAALWPERCKALVSVSGYLIASLAANQQPLPPQAELGWWYQYYFATERGARGYAAYRREFARLI